MSEWEAGDVALVTINRRKQGEQSTTDLMLRNATNSGWDGAFETVDDGDYYLRSVRRVVVIDPEDAEQVERLRSLTLQAFRDQDRTMGPLDDPLLIDLLHAALREFAAPTPPKPEEPQGLGAVVEDAEGKKWVRVDGRGSTPWTQSDAGMDGIAKWCKYAGIDALRVLSEGVTL